MIVIEGKVVPESYRNLYWNLGRSFPAAEIIRMSLPAHLYDEGERRFEEGSKEYLQETEYGEINACYHPATDTAQDIREELLDAYFNAMVYAWKFPEKKEACQLIKSIVDCLIQLEVLDNK